MKEFWIFVSSRRRDDGNERAYRVFIEMSSAKYKRSSFSLSDCYLKLESEGSSELDAISTRKSDEGDVDEDPRGPLGTDRKKMRTFQKSCQNLDSHFHHQHPQLFSIWICIQILD